METEIYRDFEYTGPGTLAGRYMRAYWQPIYRAEDLLPNPRGNKEQRRVSPKIQAGGQRCNTELDFDEMADYRR